MLKEWSKTIHDEVIKTFSKWEKDNLIITYGKRELTSSDTYGLPYTSSSNYAMVSNTNVEAVYKYNTNFYFNHVAVSKNGEIRAYFTDKNDKEAYIEIG